MAEKMVVTDGAILRTLVAKEVGEALRSRWFLGSALGFGALALLIALLGLAGSGRLGLAGFGRTSAGLVNLVMLITPLMGLVSGATALAGEWERGTLALWLTQPLSRAQFFLGKTLGLGLALAGALLAGLGLTGVLLALGGSAGGGGFLALLGFTLLLGEASLAIGLMLSTFARRSGMAVGVALLVWLGMVLLGDLGLMGSALIAQMPPPLFLGVALLNPLQDFRLGAVLALGSHLEVLGPVGLYAGDHLGGAMPFLTAGLLALWIVVPLAIAYWHLARSDAG
ncbi:hypothetical protein HRbin23_01379 [bacterium HR23]|nr:hypothetical protein HRbin23_01379 [bacterium HR23]